MLFSKLLYDFNDVSMKINHWFFFFLHVIADEIVDFYYYIIKFVFVCWVQILSNYKTI